MGNTKTPLVSIIVPVFNAEKFLNTTIDVVLSQTYSNWELLFIDDRSTDKSTDIINSFKDKRIKLILQSKNGGAAKARNAGINAAKGDYICFLDADDIWVKDKLEKQLKFMEEKQCAFSFTGYEFANEKGRPNGKKVFVPEKISYKKALKNTTIFISTVMFNMDRISKDDIKMPLARSEDTATWWKVLKKVDYAYGLNEILSFYRRSDSSKSANKLRAISQTWELYRKFEKFGIVKSAYYFCWYAINAVRRRI